VADGRWRWRAATILLGGALLVAPVAGPVAAPSYAGGGPHAHADPSTHTPREPTSTDDEPLHITITGLEPGVLPQHGPVTVTGTVTNADSVAWEDVALYPYLDGDDCVGSGTCSAPMHTAEELAQGADVDPASPVGVRVVEVTQKITSLAPGASVPFSLKVPQPLLRRYISDPQPGVYWFGVQAIGASSTTPRDLVGDGRALTYLPYVPAGFGRSTGHPAAATLDTALVVPLRANIVHRRDGRLTDPRRWLSELRPHGTLGGPLAVGAATGGLPVTWLVDPAVLDAVHQLQTGNKPRLVPAPGQTPSPSASATTTQDDGTSGSGSAGPLAAAAGSWLTEAHRALGTGQLLALPYGDPQLTGDDATAELYTAARSVRGLLREWKLPFRRTVSGPEGYVDPAGLAQLPAGDHSTLLLGSGMLSLPTTGGTLGDHPVVVTQSKGADGGPGTDDRYSAIEVRQRILAEAAVRLLAGDDRPLVVELPQQVDSENAGQLWSGLIQPWLHLTTVTGAARHGSTAIDRSKLHFPDSRAGGVRVTSAQDAAAEVIPTGRLLQSILTPVHDSDSPQAADNRVADAVTGEALAATSYSSTGDSTGRLAATRLWLLQQLGGISISVPPGVTLSSASGSFAVTLTNDLDVPVTVGIAADAAGVRVKKSGPVQLAPHSRASVRLEAHTSRAGVHNVGLRLTNADGDPIGAGATVPIRSGSVGVVIWVILGIGAGILLVAIAIRLVRRLRRRSDAPA